MLLEVVVVVLVTLVFGIVNFSFALLALMIRFKGSIVDLVGGMYAG